MQASSGTYRLSQVQPIDQIGCTKSQRLEMKSEAGLYTYDVNGHKKAKQSEEQRQALAQFAEFIEKDNEDILLIPARKAIDTGFGYCRDNGNPYNISANLSRAKGRNYIQQERKLDSYSINVQTRIPDFNRK